MEQLGDKTAVVTGSGSGLGRSMAIRFAQDGMNVVVADRDVDAAGAVVKEITSAGGQALAVVTDVTDRASLGALADQVDSTLGGTDVLVNNAGVLPLTPILEPDENGWRFEMEVN